MVYPRLASTVAPSDADALGIVTWKVESTAQRTLLTLAVYLGGPRYAGHRSGTQNLFVGATASPLTQRWPNPCCGNLGAFGSAMNSTTLGCNMYWDRITLDVTQLVAEGGGCAGGSRALYVYTMAVVNDKARGGS